MHVQNWKLCSPEGHEDTENAPRVLPCGVLITHKAEQEHDHIVNLQGQERQVVYGQELDAC